jgi:hypothetical protein
MPLNIYSSNDTKFHLGEGQGAGSGFHVDKLKWVAMG